MSNNNNRARIVLVEAHTHIYATTNQRRTRISKQERERKRKKPTNHKIRLDENNPINPKRLLLFRARARPPAFNQTAGRQHTR